jgi:hypothetical protein
MRKWTAVPLVAIIATVLAGGFAATPASATEKPVYVGSPMIRSQAITPQAVQNTTSRNWAGYALTPTADTEQTFRAVTARWIQPAVTCPTPNAAVYIWVGLDGFGNGTVEQIGTSARCINGTPQYQIFWEMYPDPANLQGELAPGDSVAATVSYRDDIDQFVLSYTNITRQTGIVRTRSCPAGQTCARSSAEWIAEAPGSTVLPLANYVQANFTNCSFTDAAGTEDTPRSTTPFLRSRITQADATTTYATTGATSADGRNFTVTWQHE